MRFSLLGLAALFVSTLSAANPLTVSIAVDPLVRVVRPDTQHPGTNLVAEIQNGECRMGGEQGGRKFGVWLRMPRAACPNDLAGFGDVPRVLDATDEMVMDSNGNPDVTPAHHAAALGVPIHWTSPKDGVILARRFMAKQLALHPELAKDKDVTFARNTLGIHDDEGKIIADRNVLVGLCAKTNAEACSRAATSAKTKDEKRALLGRACQLEHPTACSVLGSDLRTDALEAAHRTAEFQRLRDFQCGIGKNIAVDAVTYEDAPMCPPSSGTLSNANAIVH